MPALIQLLNKFRFKTSEEEISSEQLVEGKRYGTFFGVYLPSVLSIFGVIMYLRLGTILGKIGLIPTLSIICFSSLITFLTALSISSVATNMKVNKGGAYYIISRSLGIDFGTAIGIPIYLAQAIGIAFYILGFSESFHASFPQFDERYISLITLLSLGIFGFFSTGIVLKTQLLIFLALIASWVSLALGKPITDTSTLTFEANLSYWVAFAVFFPAVTGILSGVSMSGELKNPRKALPIGTISAVVTGLVVYLLIALLLWVRAPRNLLATDTMICEHIARYGSLIVVGIWVATLSSALGSILGAPRTMQALAEDGIIFRFLGKEQGRKNEPRVAFLFTLVVVTLFLYVGKIDLIAPILTMFFLISYCILNLVAGLEALIHNPSWRPSFSFSPYISFLGALLCLIAMLMINAGATLISILIVFLIYFFRGRKLHSSWDNICFAILMQFTKTSVYKLMHSGFAARCWRPHLMIAFPSMSIPNYLLDFTRNITKGNSFLTFVNVIEENGPYNSETIKKSILSSLKKNKIDAFVEIQKDKDILAGYKRLILSHGIGPLTPNTLLLTHANANSNEVNPELITYAYQAGKNAVILKGMEFEPSKKFQIDIWWDSSNKKTSELILVLAHMYQTTKGVKQSHITLKSIVNSEMAREQRLQYFKDYFSNSRFNVDFKVYVATQEDEIKTMGFCSNDADLTLLGLPSPLENVDYKSVYALYMRNLKSLKNVALVVASEPVNFQEIFK